MVIDKYEQILKRFELRHPHFYEQAIDWWASGRLTIAFKLNDGSIIDYNDLEDTIRWVNVNDNADEETRRKAFGHNLQKFITVCGMSKGEIAERLGITNTMLSRYIHGKTMPSFDKGRQIAILMGCSMEELFDDNYTERKEG